MKRKREETRTAVHVLVASLTDSQPFITGFQNFYKTFKQGGLEAMFFSIVDFSSTDDKIPVSSITSTNNEPVETTKIQPQKFYITVETPAHMKKRIVECISQKTANAMPDDTVVFIPLGHGIGTGSVLIGSRRTPSIKEYLTIPEIRMAGSNLGRGATLTVVNAAWYTGGWLPLAAQKDKGTRFVRCSLQTKDVSSPLSEEYEGGVSALLSTLRRSAVMENGCLEIFIAEIRDRPKILPFPSPDGFQQAGQEAATRGLRSPL